MFRKVTLYIKHDRTLVSWVKVLPPPLSLWKVCCAASSVQVVWNLLRRLDIVAWHCSTKSTWYICMRCKGLWQHVDIWRVRVATGLGRWNAVHTFQLCDYGQLQMHQWSRFMWKLWCLSHYVKGSSWGIELCSSLDFTSAVLHIPCLFPEQVGMAFTNKCVATKLSRNPLQKMNSFACMIHISYEQQYKASFMVALVSLLKMRARWAVTC